MVDDFCFPTHEVKEIYQQSRIIKCFIYLFFFWEIEKTYNEKLLQIKEDDNFKNSKIEFSKTEKKHNEEALQQLQQKDKNTKKESDKIFLMKWRWDEANKYPKIKSIIDFDEANSNIIKSIAYN